MAFLISLCIIAGSILLIAKYLVPIKHLSVTDAFYTTKDDIEWRVSTMSYEYAPKGITTILSPEKTTKLAIKQSDIPRKPYTVLSGTMEVSINQNKPQVKTFTVQAA